MRCRTARRSLLAARDGALAAAERQAVDAHVDACEACGMVAAEIARLHRALEALPQEAAIPPGLAEATLRRMRAEMAAETPARGGWWWVGAPLAAGLAGVVMWRSWQATVVPERQVATASRPAESRQAPSGPVAPGPVPSRTAPAGQMAAKPAPAPAADAAAPRVEPPPQVAEALELYLDMPILENMEKLQNYDAIRTVDVGEGENRRGGRG